MHKQLTALEVIGMAIRSEEDAAKYYHHMSQLSTNELVREKFLNLAREETGHRKMLLALYQRMAPDAMPDRIPGSPQTAEGGGVPDDKAGSMEALLELAIAREQEAQEFYREAAAAAEDLSGRRTLTYLVEVEAGHEKMLRHELEALRNDEAWYLGEQMIHLGP